ncbi:Lpg1974 family pore-forming outer membrane protein [Simkania sp.]|uniref:Lpg1974 family pore-forming outer membrane protein n=1 Tax=Simkania sp. TaxID=34094 RepID=UPI003B51945C
MKCISFLSAAFLSTFFLGNGLVANVQDKIVESEFLSASYSSQQTIEQTPTRPMQNGEHPNGPPVPTNRDIVDHSAQGCLSQGFSIQGEFIWWRAILDNLEYGLKDSAVITDPNNFPNDRAHNFTVKEPSFEFDPGFKVAAGYDFGRDNWDLFLRWTWLHSNPSDSVNAGDNNLILLETRVEPIAVSQNFGGIALSPNGKVRWDIHFNVLDFEMGYDYFFSKRFSVRPFMGLKTAWIDMDYRVDYIAATVLEGGANDIRDLKGKGDSDYWGVGPCFGIDSYLHIGWGFSIYGLLSGAALYGEFDAKYDQINIENPPNTIEVDLKFKHDNFYRLRNMVQMALGVEWAYCFSKEYLLALHIGWETQYWWNQLEMPFFGYFQPEGDLTFSGLDVGVRFDF